MPDQSVSLLTHGANENCPKVISGEWSRCMGHSEPESQTVYCVYETTRTRFEMVAICATIEKAIEVRNKYACTNLRCDYQIKSWVVDA